MATLDLALPEKLGRGGAPAKELFVEFLRPIGEQDLVLMLSERAWKPKPIQRLRAAHHNVAILLSQGKTIAEVSRITGRSATNIQVLLQDPAFKTLMNHYTQMGQQALADVYQQLGDLGQAAIAALQEDLETDPDSIPHKDKIAIVQLTMDRVGYGPTKTVRNVNTSEALKELVEKVRAEKKGRVIDIDAAD